MKTHVAPGTDPLAFAAAVLHFGTELQIPETMTGYSYDAKGSRGDLVPLTRRPATASEIARLAAVLDYAVTNGLLFHAIWVERPNSWKCRESMPTAALSLTVTRPVGGSTEVGIPVITGNPGEVRVAGDAHDFSTYFTRFRVRIPGEYPELND